MFDLITGKVQHAPRHQAVSMLISMTAQVAMALAVVTATLLVIDSPIPREAIITAFAAPPPPPPPPPPPSPKAPESRQPTPQMASTTAVPTEPPQGIEPEAPAGEVDEEGEGVPGGIVGGVAGGLEMLAPPPPPPPAPPPPEPRKPVRIGGELKEPTLIHRVEPVYPPVAVMANVEGTVILEAIVDQEGRVESVRVLRSVPLLEKAAVEAVQQWVYSPVLLNGRPERFILTVVLRFRLEGVAR